MFFLQNLEIFWLNNICVGFISVSNWYILFLVNLRCIICIVRRGVATNSPGFACRDSCRKHLIFFFSLIWLTHPLSPLYCIVLVGFLFSIYISKGSKQLNLRHDSMSGSIAVSIETGKCAIITTTITTL